MKHKHPHVPKPQTREKHPDEWQRDLNPHHLEGQNVGLASDSMIASDQTAFHLRKRGVDLGDIDDEDLKRVPVVADGERLQQGATYIDLAGGRPPQEFTARGDVSAAEGHAYVPKHRVPYEIWNRLIGEEKPGQE